jgi:hypothetical protein
MKKLSLRAFGNVAKLTRPGPTWATQFSRPFYHKYLLHSIIERIAPMVILAKDIVETFQ